MHRASSAPIPLLFAAHVAIWTLYGVFANPGALHPDMLEAYLWGHEYQLGYFKHPPFWGWIAGAWFEVFPRGNWAFILLAVLNSGIAVLGVWRLYGLYAKADVRSAGVLLLLTTPLYTFMALRFNANAMLLSLWPWTVYFFALSIEKRGWGPAVMFGVLAAAGLLSKYYSAILLVSCIAASFVHPHARKYYRSAAPYIAVLVCGLLLVPHIVWFFGNDLQTLKYAQSRANFSNAKVYLSIVSFFFGCIAFHGVAIGLNLFSRPSFGRNAQLFEREERTAFLAVLALGPFVLTLLTGLLGHVRLSTNFAIPIFYLMPLLLIAVFTPDIARLSRRAAQFAVALYALAVPIGLASPLIMFKQHNRLATIPGFEVLDRAKKVWAETVAAPIRTVGGSFPYALIAAFYADGEVREFTAFDLTKAPWITPQSLTRDGLLAICVETDGVCRERASRFVNAKSRKETVTLAHNFGGDAAPPVTFELFIIPPEGN